MAFKLLTIIGARPQIIKASAISRAIRTHFSNEIQEIIVHTGQHYDENMSEQFFSELEIPQPEYNLNVGSGNHGAQTAKMTAGIEELLIKESPNALLVYGDTNSTLAGALAASKIGIPVVHVEAGLRSFNKEMPEEINRILCDHISTLLFCPTKQAIENLQNEGFKTSEEKAYINHPKYFLCGDIMYDNSMHFSEVSDKDSTLIAELGLTPDNYILSTIHRNANTDIPANLIGIFSALESIQQSSGQAIVLPLHPRTKKFLHDLIDEPKIKAALDNPNIHIIPPAGFLDIIALEKNASLIVTDSGGLQKEAFFFHKPCIILREQTEWVEIVENGNAITVGADEAKIIEAYKQLSTKTDYSYPPLFGDGKAAEFICQTLLNELA